VFQRVIGNFLFHCDGCDWLLGPDIQRHAKRRRKENGVERNEHDSRDASQKSTPSVAQPVQRKSEASASASYDVFFSFLPTTSSMLVPRSLSMTMAALRPGVPVTDPPGAVVPPV
jgi:hypothetical protein